MRPLAHSIAQDRQRLGLSQQELASKLGVSQQSVSKWEEGAATPRGKRLARLAQVFGNTSQTAAQVEEILRGPITPIPLNMRQDPAQVTQEQALAALAHAAQQIAQAAKTLAESVVTIANQKPSDKH